MSGKKGKRKWLCLSCRVIHMNCPSPWYCLKRDYFAWKNSTGRKGQTICPDWPLYRQYQNIVKTPPVSDFSGTGVFVYEQQKGGNDHDMH